MLEYVHTFTYLMFVLNKNQIMKSIQTNNKKERLSFFVNPDLSSSINAISKLINLSVSDIGRIALQEYIDKVEKEFIAKELEEGYKANYSYYCKNQEEWKYADKE